MTERKSLETALLSFWVDHSWKRLFASAMILERSVSTQKDQSQESGRLTPHVQRYLPSQEGASSIDREGSPLPQ